MKKLLLLFTTLALGSNSFAQLGQYRHDHVDASFAKTYDPRSDTVDILNYTINLRITDFNNKIISGNTEVKLRSKQNGIQYLRLDLLGLTVDSVKQNGTRIAFNHQSSTIHIRLNPALNTGDSSAVKIYYRGTPSGDVTGWGGFYFQSGYAYNLGVGFGADPHVYGRVWFPCFDNFMERSTYDFNITTADGKIAYCNGSLINDTTNLDGTRTRSWKLTEQIPTYLASVAVGNYVDYKVNYNGIEKTYPIQLAILPTDSANVNLNIQVLTAALGIYENRFGPYRWNKVGYALVPFNQGAMEHATNIAYPRSFINSLETYSSILVHELSHHWFGNLITCSSQEEMWLNEGWASYCEYIFTEGYKGRASYINGIKTLHAGLLQFAGYKEGNINLNNVPHAYTYGDHVYSKGAIMAHNLRGYMGDSLFFSSLKTVLSQNTYKSITNDQFIDGLSAASGLNLSNYLNDWIKQGGWANFSIDSFNTVTNGTKFNAKVFVKQSTYNNINLHTNVPIEISFINDQHETFTVQKTVSGANTMLDIEVPFDAKMVVLNMNDKLSLATSVDQRKIKNIGNSNFVLGKMNVNITEHSDSSLLRIEHHYVGAGGNFASNILRISPQRYWKVDGIVSNNFKANAKLFYDGRSGVFTGNYYLDHLLNITNEDSILLLYRKDRAEAWEEVPYYKLETGASKANKYGSITIDDLKIGEYCLGIGTSINTGIGAIKKNKENLLNIYPNPAKDEIFIELRDDKKSSTTYTIEISDMQRKVLFLENEVNLSKKHKIDMRNFSSGNYLFVLKKSNEILNSIQFQLK
jgi:aminopeptidase N